MSDTLQLDSALIAQWQQDGSYDYDRELAVPEHGIMDWLSEHIRRFLGDLFDTTIDSDAFQWGLIAVGAAALLFVGWLLWKRGFFFFLWEKKSGTLDYTVETDTIYGVDFEAEISKAQVQGDYRQAVRWLYLQTLWQFSESHRIDWQPHKTPKQYVREAKDEAFTTMSRHFVRVRYGNFEATAALFAALQELQQKIGKGGDLNS